MSARPGTPALAAEGLGFGYPGQAVGRGLDLAIEAETVTMLLGPNGCGKTTLFRTLLGLLSPQAGRVLLRGRPLDQLPRRDVARDLAYVPQAAEGTFPFPVLDVVVMGRAPHLGLFESPGARDRARAEAALDAVGLADLAGRPFTAISGGQRQLVLVARALAQEAPILVMDEPTANLDYGNQFRVLERARGLASAGRTVVVSSHNPDHAFRFADRAVLMRGGAVAAAGAPAQVLDAAALSAAYGIPIGLRDVDLGGGRVGRVCVPGVGPA
ncbi:MAG: ABC transporter ATP-binding protein [Hyphomicrobiales bacterium]|nr:ABC transporter ATP-binding protein [Hyphomicrobiales bacterium]MCP5370819.1 ABC transporter ATP-binding protein [Hyphomicrobiales bacterium]